MSALDAAPLQRPRRWPFALLLALSALAFVFCLSGLLMAGDFAWGEPAVVRHWQLVGRVYGAGALASLALGVVSAVALRRRRARRIRRGTSADTSGPDVRAI